MHYRELGRTGWKVSTVSFGAWAIGGTWGPTDDAASMAALHKALDLGVNFFDTADVYGDGHSEQLLARLKKERPGDSFYIGTKAGRRLDPHTAQGYLDLRAFVERSLKNLDSEAIDLLQLHCPPTATFYMPEVFDGLDRMVAAGKLRHYGVSVEKVEEAIKALDFPGVQSVQIIYNLFRQRAAEVFLPLAQNRKVGVLARLPLSSGMLTGKLTATSTFAEDDHRHFNRDGAGFDKGETFSGLPYGVGLEAVERIRPLVPAGISMAQLALRWILTNPAITCTIPGGKRPDQVADNVAAADLPALSEHLLAQLDEIYATSVKPHVHTRW